MIVTVYAIRVGKKPDATTGMIQVFTNPDMPFNPSIVTGLEPPRGDYGIRGKIDQRLGLGR